MDYNSLRIFRWRRLVIGSLVVALLCVFRISSARNSVDPNEAQDAVRLESRITQLEQRLFAVENNVRNLDQQSSLANARSRGASQDDVVVLRAEVQALQRRVMVDECGLARLDERTLAPQRRNASKRSVAPGSDPCRLNFDEPLQLP